MEWQRGVDGAVIGFVVVGGYENGGNLGAVQRDVFYWDGVIRHFGRFERLGMW